MKFASSWIQFQKISDSILQCLSIFNIQNDDLMELYQKLNVSMENTHEIDCPDTLLIPPGIEPQCTVYKA